MKLINYIIYYWSKINYNVFFYTCPAFSPFLDKLNVQHIFGRSPSKKEMNTWVKLLVTVGRAERDVGINWIFVGGKYVMVKS